MRKHAVAFMQIFGCLAGLTGCAEDYPCTPGPEELFVRVIDPLNNPVPIDSVALLYDGQEHECREVQATRGVATCGVGEPGMTTLVVHVQGRTLMQDISVLQRGDMDRCELVAPNDTTIVYDGPRCDPATLEVVRGDLFDIEGQPAERATVGIRNDINGAACTVEGNHFSCPALFASSSDYEVTATIGASRLVHTVHVETHECVLAAPVELRFDRSQWPCDSETKPVATVFVTTRDPATGLQRNVIADSVRATDWLGNVQECVLEAPGNQPAARPFSCSATTPTGGGRYTFEATFEGRTQSVVEQVFDDGCQPSTVGVSIML